MEFSNQNSSLTVERAADESIDGDEVAVFVNTWDINAFLSTPEIQELIVDGMSNSGELFTRIPQGLAFATATLLSSLIEPDFFTSGKIEIEEEIIPTIIQGIIGEVTATEKFGMTDGYLRSYEWSLDLSVVPESPITLKRGTITVKLSRSNFNAVEAISAPEDAEVITSEMIEEALGGTGF